ncbi:PLP-dependent aminotransferase family protein [Ruegeria arenilitoris]|uniref:MocR-like pyridoxine biosynthesis transcription factor PdxR n=1 Tax=Ruegeria arenilitoris TaxID=1173585 RepID=UPI00147CACD6|nr:PLP-dependent aminotransferase family protein [Ruegeria arenilitoris]
MQDHNNHASCVLSNGQFTMSKNLSCKNQPEASDAQRSASNLVNVMNIDRDDALGIRDQIRAELAYLISSGVLQNGAKLPSCRALARDLKVSVNSVLGAYSRLVDEGTIISKPKSGYYVSLNLNRTQAKADQEINANFPNIVERITRRRLPSKAGCITRPADWPDYQFPFVCNQAASNRFPLAEWRECSRLALNMRDLSNWTGDNQYRDSDTFVEQICSRLLPHRGIVAKPENVLITMGAQQAIYIVAALLRGFGRVVAIEDPGYADARNIFEQTFDEVRFIPVDSEGLVVDERLAGCDLVYVTPNRQMPTVLSMSQTRKRQLLDMAKKEDFLIIEDDYEGDMDFDENSLLPLYSGHSQGRVIYTGSLSKSLAPGLRLGYLVAQESLVQEARALRGMMIRHPPHVIQHTASLFLRFGHHETHRAKMHQIFNERWHVASQVIQELFPDFELQYEYGSTNFFFRSTQGHSAYKIAEAARQRGVIIEPSSVCFSDEKKGEITFRLGISAVPAGNIEQGLRTLRSAIDAL